MVAPGVWLNHVALFIIQDQIAYSKVQDLTRSTERISTLSLKNGDLHVDSCNSALQTTLCTGASQFLLQ